MNVSFTVEGLERYPINVRYPRELRSDLESLKRVAVPTPLGHAVPLVQVADITISKGAPAIKSENARRTAWIYVDLKTSDVGGYVKRAREVVAEQIGRLSDVAAIGRGRPMSMVISPFVFLVESTPPLVPNHEVAEVLWVPANFIVDHSNRETMSYRHGDLSLELPCYRYQGHLIWGMTLGMVDELLSLVTGNDD